MAGTDPNRMYKMVSSVAELKRVIRRVQRSPGGAAGLDFETTSLVPSEGRARLVSICNDQVSALVDFDRLKGGFRAVAHLFVGRPDKPLRWIVFNAGFEQRWFNDAGAEAAVCWDLANLRKSILGGSGFSLKDLLSWDLDVDISKQEQKSDWDAKVLRPEQLDYAFDDGYFTWKAWNYWWQGGRNSKGTQDPATEGQKNCFELFNSMVPAVIEMEDAGMLLDVPAHRKLIKSWEKDKAIRIKRIRRLVPEEEVANINSDIQWSNYLSRVLPDQWILAWPQTPKSGQLVMKNEVLLRFAGQAVGTPLEKFLDALAEYKTVSKYLSSFGETLITAAAMSGDGRVHASFRIMQAKTRRFSSAGPNLQQVPRDKEILGKFMSVRTSFIAMARYVLVSLDYSGIELRVLALLSGDQTLLADCIDGDVHAEVASAIAGKPIDKKTRKGKALRQAAKAVSFGIVYGSGAAGLAATMRTSIVKAQGYIDFWMTRYPKAFAYREKMMAEAKATGFITCVDGGTIYMSHKPEMPKCANYPVQNGAMAVMAAAITRHKNSLEKERAKGRMKKAKMLATIHDALIDEVAKGQAKRLLAIMKKDMEQALLDIFPGASIRNLVEGGIGPNWGELG